MTVDELATAGVAKGFGKSLDLDIEFLSRAGRRRGEADAQQKTGGKGERAGHGISRKEGFTCLA
ncbi:MAG: hypothetical protein WDM81_15750 [Rhizomicrobium sp.]